MLYVNSGLCVVATYSVKMFPLIFFCVFKLNILCFIFLYRRIHVLTNAYEQPRAPAGALSAPSHIQGAADGCHEYI